MTINYFLRHRELGDNTFYRAQITNNRHISRNKLVDRIHNMGSTLTKVDIEGVLLAMEIAVRWELEAGNRVSIGDLVELYPVIEGRFTSLSDKFDHQKHKFRGNISNECTRLVDQGCSY